MRLQESIRPHIDRTADDHLCQLQRRDDHWDEAWGIEASRLERIVAVHHGVHTVVHHNEPAGGTSVFGVAEPRVDQHSDVVIPVQEDQWLFTQYDEYRIAQFWQFAQYK